MTIPLVYLDTCVYLTVLKKERWHEACVSVLEAYEREQISLAASTVLLMELYGWRGDVPQEDSSNLVARYLTATKRPVHWTELDLMNAHKIRGISQQYGLRGADAAHLAAAIRLKSNFFFSFDKRFPHGTVVEGVEVCHPKLVWQATLEDSKVQFPPA